MSCSGESNKGNKQERDKTVNNKMDMHMDTVFKVKAYENWSNYQSLSKQRSIKFKLTNGFPHNCIVRPSFEKWQNGKLIDSDYFSVSLKMKSTADLAFDYTYKPDSSAMNVSVENEFGGTFDAKVEIPFNTVDSLYVDVINKVSAFTSSDELLIGVIAPENDIKRWYNTNSIKNGVYFKVNLLKE